MPRMCTRTIIPSELQLVVALPGGGGGVLPELSGYTPRFAFLLLLWGRLPGVGHRGEQRITVQAHAHEG